MRCAIFTNVLHQKQGDRYFGYAPYVREMNLWFKQVDEVEVVAPVHGDSADFNYAESYDHRKLFFTTIPAFDLLNLSSSIASIFSIPLIIFRIFGAMHRADHFHLRCPGNVGLLSCVCQIFFPSKSKTAKYAGNWDPEAKQPWSYKLQKWILQNTFLTRNMQVLVYGEWPSQSKNVKSFFTASFSEKEIPLVGEKSFEEPISFLFVGNLVPGKHPLKAVQLVQELRNLSANGTTPEGRAVRLEIYGDGPERKMLEIFCRNENLKDIMTFKGNRTLEELKEAYQKAHFVILPSESEGWPKAIAEGMFFGCIPIATPVSCVPWMLDNGKRGVLLKEVVSSQEKKSENIKPEQEVGKLVELLMDKEEMKRQSKAAKRWSQQYTLEKFEEAIQEVLTIANRKKG